MVMLIVFGAFASLLTVAVLLTIVLFTCSKKSTKQTEDKKKSNADPPPNQDGKATNSDLTAKNQTSSFTQALVKEKAAQEQPVPPPVLVSTQAQQPTVTKGTEPPAATQATTKAPTKITTITKEKEKQTSANDKQVLESVTNQKDDPKDAKDGSGAEEIPRPQTQSSQAATERKDTPKDSTQNKAGPSSNTLQQQLTPVKSRSVSQHSSQSQSNQESDKS